MNRYVFGRSSKEKLQTCHPQLQQVMNHAIEISPIDFSIIEGSRTVERQKRLYAIGASKLDGVTKISKHQYSPSCAVDAVPYPIDWQDTARFYLLAGVILSTAARLRIRLRWGGDWNSNGQFNDQAFHDLPHFELVNIEEVNET